MARSCVAKTTRLAPLMRLSDLELKIEIQAVATADPLHGLHLCHELLEAQHHYPTRRGLTKLVGREVECIGEHLTKQPETTQ